MKSLTNKIDFSRSISVKQLFLLILAFLLLTILSVVLDIPFLRQFLSFLFLTFLPGLLMIYILRLEKIDVATRIVLSVGLSVAFAMFYGLLMNKLLFVIGYKTPLSTISVLFSFCIATLMLSIIAYRKNRGLTTSLSALKLTTREKAFLVLPALFPLLSILGIRLMNMTDNNVLLMILFFMIWAYVIYISVSKRRIPEKVYPVTIFFISISLLLMFSLRGLHVTGGDTHIEYNFFQRMLSNGYWSVLGTGNLDSCLIITLLPTIYQALLNINPEFLYKILYSLMGAFLPLAIYLLARKYVGSFYAFLACIFFMSQVQFQWTPAYARNNPGALFFALALMVLFSDNISDYAKRPLFIIFSASVIVSHYSSTFIFFFILLFTWLGMQLLKTFYGRKMAAANPSGHSHPIPANTSILHKESVEDNPASSEPIPQNPPWPELRRNIAITLVLLFLTMIFFWYSQVMEVPFNSGVGFIRSIFRVLGDFAVTEARGATVQAALITGLGEEIPKRIEFVFSWLTILFIAIGVFTTLKRFLWLPLKPYSGHGKGDVFPKRPEVEFLVLTLMCSLLAAVAVILPRVTQWYGMSRVYLQVTVVLSIFFVVGGLATANFLKVRARLVILLVLIPYSISATGVTCQFFDFPRSMILNTEGIWYNTEYVHDRESYSAIWLGEHYVEVQGSDTDIFTDRPGVRRLVSQSRALVPGATIHGDIVRRWQNRKGIINGIVYLRPQNTVRGELIGPAGVRKPYSMADFASIFTGKNKVYANGGSEIYTTIGD
ncbi:DUF2206 domain-containing protein [Chloroflexota bacterium]